MNAQLEIGPTPFEGYTCFLGEPKAHGWPLFNAYRQGRGDVVGLTTRNAKQSGGEIVDATPAEAMACAEAIVRAVADADPDNFERLWMGLVRSVRTARTAPPSAGWTDAEIEHHEAQHPGDTPPTDEEAMDVLATPVVR